MSEAPASSECRTTSRTDCVGTPLSNLPRVCGNPMRCVARDHCGHSMHWTLPIDAGRIPAVRQEVPDITRLSDRLGEIHKTCVRKPCRSRVPGRPSGVIAFPKTPSSVAHATTKLPTLSANLCPSAAAAR